MRKTFILIFIFLVSIKSFACSCKCDGDCSFSQISKNSEFVALVKVIEYTDFLEQKIINYDGKMPLSMTVEIVEKYLGSEKRKTIKIWGDNGALCRPYIANFEIGKYYLIAPQKINENSENGAKDDYDFFSCITDYLTVDFENKIAYGKYSKKENKISLSNFEREIKSVNFKKSEWFTNNSDNKFYTADSITLFRILNYKNEVVKLNDGLIKSEHNKNLDFTELQFKRNGRLNITDSNIKNWTETKRSGKWKWKYNDNDSTLDIFYEGNLNSSFKIISQKRDNLTLKVGKNDKETKVYLYVLKLKRVRKNN